jgi:hypothetical protein
MKVSFFSAFVIGLGTHMHALVHKWPTHDDVAALFTNGNHLISGRWFLGIPAAISGDFSTPWVNGILSLVYLSLGAALVVSTLKITNPVICVLVSGLMVTMPSVAGWFMYRFAVDAIFFCVALACFAAWLATRFRYGFLIAVIPLTLAVGGYQAVFGIATGLLVARLALELLDPGKAWRTSLVAGVKYIATLGVSMAAYFGVMKLATLSTGLTAYRGIDRIGQIPLSSLPLLTLQAYKKVGNYFVLNTRDWHYSFVGFFMVIAVLMGLAICVWWCHKHRFHTQPMRLILLGVVIALLPLGCNLVFVMANGQVHDLMIFGMILLPCFLLSVFTLPAHLGPGGLPPSQTKKDSMGTAAMNLARWLAAGTIIVLIFNYWTFCNDAYLKMSVAYEQAYAQSVELVSQIQHLDGYTTQTPVIFIGRGGFHNSVPRFADENITLTGVNADEVPYGSYTYPLFITYYLGFPNPVTLIEDAVIADPQVALVVAQMPHYPNRGAIAAINGIIYVNFGIR